MQRSNARVFFKHAAEIERVLVADFRRDLFDVFVRMAQQILSALCAELVNVLVDANVGIFFKHMTQVIVSSFHNIL
jgi:hypothetical protein